MVEPVERDARGILGPDRGLRRFSLRRHEPSPAVARFVDRYWEVRWDLPDGDAHSQQVWPHPVVNVVVDGARAEANLTTALVTRTLEGRGRVLGTMFRPGGFRPLLGRPMHTFVDETRPLAEVVGDVAAAEWIDAARDDAPPGDAMDGDGDDEGVAAVERLDAVLERLLPATHHPCEETTALAEAVAADPTIRRVEDLASLAGVSPRTLQRRFADHVGVSPKRVIRRYRLYDAAERVRGGQAVDWAAVAAELGYADQAHLTRDFADAFGMPPATYARWCAAG